jgi:hypothetical protein
VLVPSDIAKVRGTRAELAHQEKWKQAARNPDAGPTKPINRHKSIAGCK